MKSRLSAQARFANKRIGADRGTFVGFSVVDIGEDGYGNVVIKTFKTWNAANKLAQTCNTYIVSNEVIR